MRNKENRMLAVIEIVAKRIKESGGDRVAQDSAVLYAKEILNDGRSAATAIEKGVKMGERMISNVIPFPQTLSDYFIDVLEAR